jgi:hypothetical protein
MDWVVSASHYYDTFFVVTNDIHRKSDVGGQRW